MPGAPRVVSKEIGISLSCARQFAKISGQSTGKRGPYRFIVAESESAMRGLLITILSTVAVVVVVVLAGYVLSRDPSALRSNHYNQLPETLRTSITDVELQPSWRAGLQSIQPGPFIHGLPSHVEVTTTGNVPYPAMEMVPPRKLLRQISDPKLPFGGWWTFEIEPASPGATLRITEDGHLANPFFRFMPCFIFGHISEIDRFLRALCQKFNETPDIKG
jgi:hypothetical protein